MHGQSTAGPTGSTSRQAAAAIAALPTAWLSEPATPHARPRPLSVWASGGISRDAPAFAVATDRQQRRRSWQLRCPPHGSLSPPRPVRSPARCPCGPAPAARTTPRRSLSQPTGSSGVAPGSCAAHRAALRGRCGSCEAPPAVRADQQRQPARRAAARHRNGQAAAASLLAAALPAARLSELTAARGEVRPLSVQTSGRTAEARATPRHSLS